MELYQKYIGSEIFVRLFKKIEQGKELTGILVDADAYKNNITMEIENEEKLVIELSQISSAHTVYDFEATLKEKKPVNLNKLNKFNKK